jgi:ribonucleoside-diphosphate reductase alpha chain
MAVAPTTSSAFILGQVSQSIEPIWSNCYVKDIDKMKITIKNKELLKLLEKKRMNSRETWESIRNNDGSIQHLDFLSEEEKAVFKTFQEIEQKIIIEQAAARQDYIDQGQSLNLAINPDVPIKEINALYMYAWQLGIKTLYYQHSINAAQQFGRLRDLQNCQSCQS